MTDKAINEQQIVKEYTTGFNDTEITLTNDPASSLQQQNEKYSYMKQNPVTNTFSRITSKGGFAIDEKHNQGELTVINGRTTVKTTVKDFKEITLSQSTSRLFRILAIEYTSCKKEQIVIPLSKYMNIIDNNDIKYVKKAVIEDLRALKNVNIEYETISGKAGVPNDAGGMGIINDWDVFDKTIFATLHPRIAALLRQSPILAYPMSLLRLKSFANNNPLAQCIGDKFAELLKLSMFDANKKKQKAYGTIGVDTMLKVCAGSGLPTYEELRTKNRLQTILKKKVAENPNLICNIIAGDIPSDLYNEVPESMANRAKEIIQSLIVSKVVKGVPEYSVVKTNFRDLTKLIIEPFDKDLEYCCEHTDFFECEYVNSDGSPLTDEQLAKPKFAEFITRKLKITPKADYKRVAFDAQKYDAIQTSKEREENGTHKKKRNKKK